MLLAGVNGAGKSSIGGFALESVGVTYFNPDRCTKQLLESGTGLTADDANAEAWAIGRRSLEQALATESNYAFETTLGGRSITDLLIEGARNGARVRMWFCGLDTPERHLQRIAARVAAGGHDIPEDKVRDRYEASRLNLIRLLPWLARLDLHDNSIDRIPSAREIPEPRRLIRMVDRRIVSIIPLDQMPDWAKPIAMAVIRVDRGEAP